MGSKGSRKAWLGFIKTARKKEELTADSSDSDLNETFPRLVPIIASEVLGEWRWRAEEEGFGERKMGNRVFQIWGMNKNNAIGMRGRIWTVDRGEGVVV